MLDLYSETLVPNFWCNFLCDWPQYALAEERKTKTYLAKGSQKVNVLPQQPLSLAKQSLNTKDPFLEIPDSVRQQYLTFRPTPLRRARTLERRLKTNARIYYKFEGANVSGSHKLNTALAQTYYYKEAGISHLVTGTGAGQWGTALAYSCKLLSLECTVFMVGATLRQKPQRRTIMEMFGATVYESPSDGTAVGREAAVRDPERIGALGIATGEALEFCSERKKTRFAVGSGENCVLLHQTVIGVEALAQMDLLGEFPSFVVACMGAGSNFAGIGLPCLRAATERGLALRLLAVEPSACPKLTRGKYAYDVSDFSGTTPIARMYTLGSNYTPPPIYAGGLRYHGTSPFLSAMYSNAGFDAISVNQISAIEAGLLFAEAEGILPAPESAHAVAGVIQKCSTLRSADSPTILVNISGHGMLDLTGYREFIEGKLEAGDADEASLCESIKGLQRIRDSIEA